MSVMKFKGRCKDLENFVYDYLTPSPAAKDYKTTTKEIGEYVGRTYEKGVEVQRIIEDGAITALAEPADLTSEELKSEVKKAIWKKQVEAHVKRMEKRDDNVCKAYMLVFGQCSEVVRSKLEALAGYEDMHSKYNLVELLSSIQTVMFSFQGQQNKTHALIDAQKRLMSMHQDQSMSPQLYLEKFKVMVHVVEHCGGQIGFDLRLVADKVKKEGTGELLATAKVKDAYLGILFLLGADRSRYGKMLDEDAHSQGRDNYPGSVLEAYGMILHRKDLGRSSAAPTVPRYVPTSPAINDVTFATVGAATVDNESLTFATNGADVLTPTPRTQRRGVQCWRCGRHGHGKPDCTETVHTDGTMLRPRVAHQLLLAAHERYDDDEMFEMRFDDTEEVTDFAFMNVGIEINELSDDESLTGACTICGRFGPNGTMCVICEDQGGIYDGDVTVPTGVCIGCGGTGDLGEYCSEGCVIRSRYIPQADINAVCDTCEREEMGRMGDDCSDCGEGAFRIHPDAMERRVARYAE
jgi:hypothetical protein